MTEKRGTKVKAGNREMAEDGGSRHVIRRVRPMRTELEGSGGREVRLEPRQNSRQRRRITRCYRREVQGADGKREALEEHKIMMCTRDVDRRQAATMNTHPCSNRLQFLSQIPIRDFEFALSFDPVSTPRQVKLHFVHFMLHTKIKVSHFFDWLPAVVPGMHLNIVHVNLLKTFVIASCMTILRSRTGHFDTDWMAVTVRRGSENDCLYLNFCHAQRT